MSRINAVRIINLNYNNNLNLVSDETFLMNGVNTLMTMDNGGGKSVLIQMMIAPFVHKQYRLLNKRPFESFFTSSKPTFVLVEWLLDHGAGYVLTGMMVRKSQDAEDANALFAEFVRNHPELAELDIPWNDKLTDLTPLLELENLQKVRISANMEAARASLDGADYNFRLDIEGE